MEIAAARVRSYRVPFKAPYNTARGSATHRHGLIVELVSARGLTGIGESAPLPDQPVDMEGFVFRTLARVQAAIGRETDDPNLSEAHTPPGAGVDAAIWDMRARTLRIPMARLLTEGPQPSVPVNALVAARKVDGVREETTAAVADGFRTIKLKCGSAVPSADIERIRAARQAAGADISIRLDANGAWSEEEAIEVLNSVADLGIEYCEQPVGAGALEAMARVRAAVPVAIAADEDVTSADAARRVMDAGAADVLVLKPLQLGGVSPTLAIMGTAVGRGVRTTVTTSIDSGVGTAAALHLAAWLPEETAAGLATLGLLESSLVIDAPAVEAGRISIPQAPGIGVELDEDALSRYVLQEWRFGRW